MSVLSRETQNWVPMLTGYKVHEQEGLQDEPGTQRQMNYQQDWRYQLGLGEAEFPED